MTAAALAWGPIVVTMGFIAWTFTLKPAPKERRQVNRDYRR